jgi:hypothetical protein
MQVGAISGRIEFMSNRFKQIASRVENWPEADQDQAADILLALETERAEPVTLTEGDVAALEASAEDVRQGHFASDQEVRGIFRRYRR